jgi:hypothetical protein
MNYKWIFSYEDYAFDTLDGSLHKGEYALANDSLSNDERPVGGAYLIHNPNDPMSFIRVKTLDTTGMTEVHRVENRAFDVFQDPDTGKRERYKCDLKVYRDLAKKGAGPRTKIKE